MLMTREAICQDSAVDKFTNAILDRDQPRTADLFFQLVKIAAGRCNRYAEPFAEFFDRK